MTARLTPAAAAAASLALSLLTSSAQAAEGFQVESFEPRPGGILGLAPPQVLPDRELQLELWVHAVQDQLLASPIDPESELSSVSLLPGQLRTELLLGSGLRDWAEWGVALPMVKYWGEADVWLGSMSEESTQSVLLGDVRVNGRVDLLQLIRGLDPRAETLGWGLGVGGVVFLPTGSVEQFQGDGQLRVEPDLHLGWQGQRSRAVLQAGWVFRAEPQIIEDFVLDSGLKWGLGWGLALPERSSELMLSTFGVLHISDQNEIDGEVISGSAYSPAEAQLGWSWHLPGPVKATLGVGSGINQGIGSPSWRVMSQLSSSRFFRDSTRSRSRALAERRAEGLDSDSDGWTDLEDRCPFTPAPSEGSADGCPGTVEEEIALDEEGREVEIQEETAPALAETQPDSPASSEETESPGPAAEGSEESAASADQPDSQPPPTVSVMSSEDPLAVASLETTFTDADGQVLAVLVLEARKDQDGDGVHDKIDACVDEAEDADQFQDEDGCPDLDNDHDGVPDTEDACPLQSGPPDASQPGCQEGAADDDGDGIVNAGDRCPDHPEDLDGYLDTDGCSEEGESDPLAELSATLSMRLIADSDGDGVEDAYDACPDDPEDQDSFEDMDGCPESDNDGDGFLDADDPCPLAAGEAPGCPDENAFIDPDGDGIPDPEDQCPQEPESVNDYQDEDGCPDEVPVSLRDLVGVLDDVQFQLNSYQILPSSTAVLNEVLEVLKRHEELSLFVAGFTDNQGDEAFNLNLSSMRAKQVESWLQERGIEDDRLESQGFGSKEPVAPNTSADGQARNRRVEFRYTSEETGKEAAEEESSTASEKSAVPAEKPADP